MIQNYNIEKYINLKSYSESLGWIGYYGRKDNYSHLLMSESIHQFISYFKEIVPEVSIITSLYKFKTNNSRISTEQLELIKLGYLSNFTQEYNDRDNENSRTLKFFKDVKWDIVRKLSSIIMDNDGDIAGHCFIIFETLHLIIYPHDDTGYGFISSSKNIHSLQIINAFFNQLDTNKFLSQIKELKDYYRRIY